MIQKLFGNTRQKVSAIGQGTTGSMHCDEKTYVKVLKMGIENGMTLIDTAEVYGSGRAEKIVGKAIQGQRHKVFISSKVFQKNIGFKPLLKACEGSLKRLGVETIDLYQIHWPNPRIPLDETLAAMHELMQKGKIRFFGLSNFSKKEGQEVCSLFEGSVSSMQAEYNLFDRTAEKELIPYCENMKMSLLAYSPLNQARQIKDLKQQTCLSRLAKKYSKTPSQIVLNWLISKPVVIPIPRTTNPNHLMENAKASNFRLSVEDQAEIDRVFKTKILKIPVGQIQVAPWAQEEGKVYFTVQEAKKNKYGFVPSPMELSEQIKSGEFLKPVRVMRAKKKDARIAYDLVEGRIRYWAWVIAFKGQKPIPAICY